MELFIWGTFWFWTLIIVGFITVTYFVEKQRSNGWGALLTALALGVILFFFGSKEPITNTVSYIVHHPFTVLALIAGYFVAGTVWSMVKWYFHLKKLQRLGQWPTKYEDTSVDFRDRKQVPVAPVAKDHRSDILMWMSWWPFSALWTLIDNPFRRVFEWIFNSLEGTFNSISQRVFKSAQPKG